jgi:hypothetical protein
MRSTLIHTVEGLGFAAAAATAMHLLVAPRLATWGATLEEGDERLPGDELVPRPATTSTRAVTIEAPAEVVWSWLVQIGTDRGGWYTYDALERAAGVPVHNTEVVREEWQRLAVGDRVRLAPPGWLGLAEGMSLPVARLDEGSCIVLRQAPPDSPWDGVWSFHVRPIGADRCRLLARSRTARPNGPARVGALLGSLVADPVTFVMERGMLLGIKRRAEAMTAATSPVAAGTLGPGPMPDLARG